MCEYDTFSVLLPIEVRVINNVAIRRPMINEFTNTNVYICYKCENQTYMLPAIMTAEYDIHYSFHAVQRISPEHHQQYIQDNNIVAVLNPNLIHEITFYYPYYMINKVLYDTTLISKIKIDALYLVFDNGTISRRYVSIIEGQYIDLNMTSIGDVDV